MEQQLTSALPQDKPPSRRAVAELAGRFKGSAAPSDAAGKETDKPVRRRPPRSLHIPKTQAADEPEPEGFTSPVPKAKRNSALIEKLQANLALSPSAMLPSPKSPGFRLVAPSFSPLSPGSSSSIPLSTVSPTSPAREEEGPVSFEDPLTAAEGSVLSNINKGRARHSLRRRPPSRRHRKSSSGDEVSVPSDAMDSSLASLSEPRDEGGEKEGGGEVFKKEETAEFEDEKEEEKESKRGKEEESVSGRREEEESVSGRREEEESVSGRREEEESTSASGRPEEEESTSGRPEEEESTSGRREEEESTSGRPEEEESTSGRPEEEESTSGRREEEESTSEGREGESAERPNEGATTTEDDKKETSSAR